jgi:SHS2 domain-containing protein
MVYIGVGTVNVKLRGAIIRYKCLYWQKAFGTERRTLLKTGEQGESGTQRWAHFQHVADIGVRGFGATLSQAFEQAALALTAVITEPEAVRPQERVDFACAAPNAEFLLVDWLNDLVFEMATRGMLFSRFEVAIDNADGECRLKGRAWGEAVDVSRHQPAAEVKGATLSELDVAQTRDGAWRAQCIVDV